MLTFYKPHASFLSEHSVDPDKRRYVVSTEGPKHYIDIDSYGDSLLMHIPYRWDSAVVRYTEDTLQRYGILPWWINTVFYRLTEAFKARDAARILKLSADLGHYVADAHVPLHASSNHNGQKTGQHGIHAFWESRVPELLAEKEWNFFIGKAAYINNVNVFIWKRVQESAAAADTVLTKEKELTAQFGTDKKYAFENRNGKVVRQYSAAFSKAYNAQLNGMIERRMQQSIYAIASLWYTAWVDAGQPTLSNLTKNTFTAEDVKAFEELNKAWRDNNIKDRAHEMP